MSPFRRLPGAAIASLADITQVLSILKADMRVSGVCARQRTVVRKIRDALSTLEWLLDYESARCDHDA